MTALAEVTGETVHLSVLEGTDVVYVDKIESAHHIRAHTSVGMRAPAFTMATGKAMLAQMPDEYLENFRPHLRRYTDTTRTTIEELREDIHAARVQGYSSVASGGKVSPPVLAPSLDAPVNSSEPSACLARTSGSSESRSRNTLFT
jgi:DNA-binding IclR family transcriptional regulator